MSTLIILVTVALYAAALFIWVRTRVYCYTVVLVAGHLTAFLDPVWQRLYKYGYSMEAPIILDRVVPLFIIIGSAWLYTLPALLLFYSYSRRWWPRNYISGITAFLAMVLYHLIVQGLAKRTELWFFYPPIELRWNIPYWLFIAVLGALVSLLIGTVLDTTSHYAGFMLIPTLSVGIVAVPVLVYGILGAPFWLSLMQSQSVTLLTLGALLTMALAAWVVHLTCSGLRGRTEQRVR